MDAGLSPEDLAAAGFSEADIAAAETIAPKGISDEMIKKAGCDPQALKRERLAGVSAMMIKRLAGCSAKSLKDAGFSDASLIRAGFDPAEIAAIKALVASPVSDSAIKAAGCDIANLKLMHDQGVSAKKIHDLNGCSADALKKAGYGLNDLVAAGFSANELSAAGFSPQDIAKAFASMGKDQVPDEFIKQAGCDIDKLKQLRQQGVSAKRIHELNGCSADALRKAGYELNDLAAAGFTPEELLAAGFTPNQLAAANLALSPAGVVAAGRSAECSVSSLKAARAMGLSAAAIRHSLGCSAAAMKAAGYTAAELKEAGFSAAELKAAGFSAADLKNAGFSAKELRAAGFSAAALKAAGFDAKALKDAGFSAGELKAAGFSADELKKAGFSATELAAAGFSLDDLKKAGFSAKDLKDAGFTAAQLKAAGFSNDDLLSAGISSRDSALAALDKLPDNPNIPSAGLSAAAQAQAANAAKLEKILAAQKLQQADQRFQQKVQQRASQMLAAANQAMQEWKTSPQQVYLASASKGKDNSNQGQGLAGLPAGQQAQSLLASQDAKGALGVTIKTGDIIFAVIDTSVNSDEPGPILASIVSGPLKGSKLIGSFNLPSNADKMVISFNTLSIPGATKTLSIAAFAIDPNTARTALSSETDHHYLSRYGSLFASTFLEGFGNAFQSADTTITIGGTGGTTDTTVQNGIGRSSLENAVIGLANVGKAWGQVAQQNMSRPTTVQIFSGTGVGVLFTQDITL